VAGFLLVNPRAGSRGPDAHELVAEAEKRGIEARILRRGEDAADLARAARAEVLGMAGGDGSLAPVAEVALERGLAFVVVPFGTRNHFARDVGLERDDPVSALDAFAGERERTIDVGRVDGTLFLNNVSFGLYARLVHRRERHRRRRDAFARLRALWLAARDRDPEPIVLDGNPVRARILLVANNAYELDVLSVGERARLDEGKLHAYLAQDWWPRTWDERVGEAFRVGPPQGQLRAAVDGEPVVLESPVELRVEPAALRVRIPPDGE
jgi:diacylglycerol kinase family enzyme